MLKTCPLCGSHLNDDLERIRSFIVPAVSKVYGVDPTKVIEENVQGWKAYGPKRKQMEVRWCVADLLCDEGLSYNKIGKILKRDHKTVYNSLHRVIELDMNSDPVYKAARQAGEIALWQCRGSSDGRAGA